ncbi:MAG: hypothetical protein JNJ57_02050 [Saprospiraceae bacterium]|nr:hypothetical protein [Saprospiraceae bacterium]
MKKLRVLSLAAFALIIAGLNSCSKTDPVQQLTNNELSAEVKAKITSLGFDVTDAYVTEGGYIVENDIFLTDEDLNQPIDWQSFYIAEVEQYRTTKLVTGLPRNITIRVASGVASSIIAATDAAIARYNAEGLQLTFSRVTSGGNIVIKKAPNGAGYIASAGFPTSTGNPYSQILFNNTYGSWNANTLASIIAHEVGHCIGFRHTDYMDRSYSCGGGYYNEGASTVGAVHIPGTPTGPDAASWMLACIGNGTNRPFNANDQTALSTLY